MSDSETPLASPSSPAVEPEKPAEQKRLVSAVVALSLLEVIRARDLPSEILYSEDPTQTMPRRLGLSDAVDGQIRRFKEDVRRKTRLSDDETRDLFHLVLRRPDSEEVFFQAGELLAGKDSRRRGLSKAYPRKALFLLARRQVRRRLKALFGRTVGDFAPGPFTLEARGHFFLDMDPGGDACALLTGLAQTILARYLPGPPTLTVTHPSCQALKQEHCRWTLVESEADGEANG